MRVDVFGFYASAFASMAVLVGHWMLLLRAESPSYLLLGLVLLPTFLFFFPLGFLVDKYAKTKVLRWSAFLIFVAALGAWPCYYMGARPVLYGLLFVLSVLANLHGVARYALVKEMWGVRRLASATAGLQVCLLMAVLAAVHFVSWGFEYFAPVGMGLRPFSAIELLRPQLPIVMALAVFALLSWIFSIPIAERKEAESHSRMRAANYMRGLYLLRNLRNIWNNATLRQSALGLSLFWGLVLMLVLLFQKEGPVGWAVLGLAVGSFYAARMSSEFIETGLLPWGALGASCCLVALFFVDSDYLEVLLYCGLGFSGGVFVVPLYALCLYNTRSHTAGGVVSTLFLVRGIFLGVFLLLNQLWLYLGIGGEKSGFLLLAFLTLAGLLYMMQVLPQALIRQLLRGVFTNLYRLRVRGVANIPWDGPLLLVGNHVSLVDWALLQMACPRPLRIVMSRNSFEKWYVRLLLNHLNLILMDPDHPALALEDATKALQDGQAVAVFPEISLSGTGNLNPFRLDITSLLQDTTTTVVPFYVQGLWGSSYSLANARYQESIDGQSTHNVIVVFGAPLPPQSGSVAIQRKVQELSIDAWSSYIRMLRPIAHSFLRTAKKVGSAPMVFSPDGNHFSGTRLLAGVLSFAREIERTTVREPRIGILLPPSGAGLLCNLAILAKGKTVVNLNYSSGTTVIQDCIVRAGIATVYTSRLFAARLLQRGVDVQALATQCKIVYAEDLKDAIPQWRMLYNFVRARLLPARWLEFSDFHNVGLDDVAAIMFSSGSEGAPKGIELTHYNFMGNIKQVTSVLNPTHNDVMLGSLPMFHAFGLAVTSFMPVIEGIPVVMQPDPTDAKMVGRVCAEFRVTIMVGTSTFLRMYATSKHVHPLMFRHVRLIFAGAEKLRDEVRQLYRTKFQIEIFEGYGTTETTPVASVNIYDTLLGDYQTVQVGNKVGTVGTPLPGSQFRVVDPDSLQELPVGADGLILIGGAQIMKGYLDDPERTALAVVTLDGKRWYKTGDKGHVDSEGFLTIVDRYSRFAKLGGEMVSLGAIEQRLGETGALDGHDYCIVAIPDATKGERVVLLYSGDKSPEEIRQSLRQLGLPPLFVPSLVFGLESVPKLGTGKADFAASKRLAMELARS